MDNSQNNQNTGGQQLVPQAQSQQNKPSQQPSAGQNPVSGSNKEMGPIEAPVAEYVAASNPQEIEPVLVPEVKEAGVETAPNGETPELGEEHKKIGITKAPEVTPVAVSDTPSVQLPTYTYPQVQQQIKDTPVEESAHWLAVLHKFILEKLGVRA
jgi:hypothetical protein